MKNKALRQLLSSARQAIKGINGHYNAEFYKNHKSDFDKLLCTEYLKIEEISLSAIKQLSSASFPRIDVKAKLDLLRDKIVNYKFRLETNSFVDILDSVTNETINLFYNTVNLIVIIAIEEIYNNISSDLLDENRLVQCITLLQEITKFDLDELAKTHLQVEHILLCDPSEVYQSQTAKTCAFYRYMISELAMKLNVSEVSIANNMLEQSLTDKNHIGFHLYNKYNTIFGKGLRRYILHVVMPIFAVILSVCLAIFLNNYYLVLFIILPLYEIMRPVIEFFIQNGLKTSYAPRMNLNGIIPAKYKTCIALSTLLPREDSLEYLESKIEHILLTNDDFNVNVAVLADFEESNLQMQDNEKPLLNLIDNVINRINKQYNNRVILLVRNREFSKTQQKFIGKNRKLGAISHLIDDICSGNGSYHHVCGDRLKLNDTKYILTLDYDTILQIDSAYELVCIAAHPVNMPVIDKKKQVVSGYGVINPRISLELKSSLYNSFTSVMGGIGGVSSYSEEISEFNQVLFDNSIFTGKGLINVHTYSIVMHGKIKNEMVLSHDIIEGIYLKTLHVGDIEFLDGFPTNATAYFKRLHRWIRGDVQNIPFIFQKDLSISDKHKLVENIRRAITPIFSLMLLLSSSIFLRVIGVLSVISPYIFSIIIQMVNGTITSFTTQTFTNMIPNAWNTFAKSFFELIFTPKYAFTAFTAFFKGMYRRFISKRKMLEWATAAQVQSEQAKAFVDFAHYIPSIICAIISLLNGAFTLGVLFLLGYPLALKSRKKAVNHHNISEPAKRRLIDDASKMMRYYRDNIDESNNYLPPDSVQFSPVYRVCNRTSPTNIGMMLLSFLSARELEIINTKTLIFYVSKIVDTIEKLDKFHGNLYNWYDTTSLEVLPNKFVSTVDSGNLVCCLVALRQGLLVHCGGSKIIERISSLIKNTDLSVFYNEHKKLFSIGYDMQQCKLSESHYDMLMSEARMTSYFAIATNQAPKEHWQALSRTLSRQDTYTGAISWTGTMFEYFMPELLLHSIRGSLSFESLQYCVLCQKNRVKNLDIPYGISESAIYAFDTNLNYQYNPNGVQRLALKSEQNKNLVISPYSTYLTLSHDFEDSCRNLIKFDDYSGKYGYYECIDYTESRVGKGGYKVVRSYMAHHIGMSIVAIANAVCGNAVQKMFLSDKQMSRATALLQEKAKFGEVVLFKQIKREEAKSFMIDIENEQYFGELHPQNPRVKLLNNGDITLVLTDIGVSEMIKNELNITRHTTDMLKNPLGTFCFINTNSGVMSLTYAPSYDENIAYESSMTSNSINYYARGNGIKSKIKVSLCQAISSEIRSIHIKNDSASQLDTSLIVFFEPCLQKSVDFDAHKAFSKLFINVAYDQHNNAVIVTRRNRDGSQKNYVAVGLDQTCNFDLITNRESLFERNNIEKVKQSAFTNIMPSEAGVSDQIVGFRIPISLGKNEFFQINMITAVGDSKQQAIDNLLRGKTEKAFAVEQLRKNSLANRITQVVLPQILYSKYDSTKSVVAKSTNNLGVEVLWKFGIGIDKPILLVELFSENSIDRITGYVDCYYHLLVCGIRCTIVFLCETETDLVKDCVSGISAALNSDIFAIGKNDLTAEEVNLLTAMACHIATKSLIRIETPLVKYKPIKINKVSGKEIDISSAQLVVHGGAFVDNSFVITETPEMPWCHILASKTFGTLLSDKSLGFTWAINSRQNKLTTWSNDTMMDNNGELLLAKIGNEYYNLIDGATVEYNPKFAKFYSKFDDYTCGITVSVPAKGMIKYIDVEIENVSDSQTVLELCYYNNAVLGVDKVNSQLTKFNHDFKMITATNPSQLNGRCYMGMTPFCSEFDYVCDRADFYTGNWNKNSTAFQGDSCIAIVQKVSFLPKEKKSLRFALAFSTTKEGLEKLIELAPNKEYETQRIISVETNYKPIDLMVNTWLPHQISASRLFGRTAFYQCGGAYGFRDQLQDVGIYAMLSPNTAKTHIIRCCASQFEEGDVLHWWHTLPSSKMGVRSRYSDDLVWLPYVLCEYINLTGDFEILSIMVKYLTAPELEENQKDVYLKAKYADYKDSVYNHCKRALKRAYNISVNGLVKIGGGDWNDGYSNVGAKGVGESVWLSQFLAMTLKSFSRIASHMDDRDLQDECITRSAKLLEAIDASCYDKDHYIRAIYDNGEKMGAYSSDECKLDSLTQSFAVFCDMRDENRVITALDTAYDVLVDKKHGVIKLFYPAFANSFQEPGYVKAYPKGVRENGGQYTHAAIWFAIAMKEVGKYEEFFYMAEILNPINKYMSDISAKEYKLEPYYIAADVYTNDNAYGKGGWSIYTGSAAWYYKLLVNHILGIEIESNNVRFSPCLPSYINSYKAFIKSGDENIDYTHASKR